MHVNDVTRLDKDNEIAVITTDSPPVNAISAPVRQGIASALETALKDDAVKAIILICEGRTFFAGADISEFGKPKIEPDLRAVQAMIEAAAKPVVAAIHGTALGGGLETALVCHYRIAVPSARMGLPEVALGLMPGAGGTQRLPRLIGVEKALELMTAGRQIEAGEAHRLGLLDELAAKENLRADAIAFARRIIAENRPLVKLRDREDKLTPARENPGLFDAFRQKNARKFRGFKAPENIIRSVQEGLELEFDAAMARERELFDELMADSQSAAQRHIFFAQRIAAKVADIGKEIEPLPIRKAGVIGAGTMGGGIAMNFANAGIPVILLETSQAALDRGLAIIRKNYETTASKGKMRMEDVDARMALLQPTLSYDDLADVDLVIEAVFEDLAIKQDVFARLDAAVRQGAILATNTSYLDVEKIAAATTRPESVIGLHFFSPANVMKLLEIVRAETTSKQAVATAVKLAKTIGKIAVVVGNGFGFVGNRILAARSAQADQLVLEGATPEQVDKALYDFGFPMGHFQMRDLVGLNVGWDKEKSASATVREVLNEMGHHGQKSGGGYYDYDENRQHTPSQVALEVIADFAAKQGIAQRAIGQEEILDRTLYAMVNEGANILDEGIAARSSDIDIIWVSGYGFPRYRGGPMFWAICKEWPRCFRSCVFWKLRMDLHSRRPH